MANTIPAIVTPEVLRWARELDSISIEDIAKKMKVSTERVQQWENGEAYPTLNQAKELAKQTIRLPNYVTMRKSISDTIDYLEDYNMKNLSEWQNQPWLRGSLGIVFDESGCVELNGILLKYDNEFGLREEKEDGKV